MTGNGAQQPLGPQQRQHGIWEQDEDSETVERRAKFTTRDVDVKTESDDRRPLTFRETLDEVRNRLANVRGTWWERPLMAVAVLAGGVLAWVAVSVVVPWPGGILEAIQRTLAMDVGWLPIPAPDDPRLAADTSLAAAAWAGAPLMLSAFWFSSAYHLDRSSRRAFGTSRIPGVRHSRGYTLMAVLLVFPLLVLGLASGAWGLFTLGTWAVTLKAWGAAGTLVGVLLAVGLLVRLANTALDRRSGASKAPDG